jgi:hypothetical protein
MNAVMNNNSGTRTGRVGAIQPQSTRESSSLHPLDLVNSDGVIEAFRRDLS